jgi:hypothetical protein
MAEIKNHPEIFGRQLLFNAADDIVGEYGDLLLAPTDIGTYELVELVEDLGGICYPAHIDRASNSVISNLGLFPDDLGAVLEALFKIFISRLLSLFSAIFCQRSLRIFFEYARRSRFGV